MALIQTEDASDRLHLSLLSSPQDHDNPNTGLYSYNEAAQGQGTWIVIMNTGYNWEQFPEEFGRPDEPRPLVVWRVPEQTRNRELEEWEIAAGLHWPPDNDSDYGYPFEGVPEGHGTQTAILAGGMRTGVAPRAGLYLIKAGGAVLDRDDVVVEEDVCAPALVVSLRHIVDKLKDGSLPPGKTVIIIDTIWNIQDMKTESLDGEQNYIDWYEQVDSALQEIDQYGGVSISVAAGNAGKLDPPGETGAFMPNILSAQEHSPLVIVGAVTSQGQLARLSSPASLRVPITCFAMGKDILLPDLSVELNTLQSGTTFAAAIVVRNFSSPHPC
ncbi:hypothetical protein LA080_011405 [Diaporthe eres]|nr:hypothetical protein LA080_011405 [Diaporthe eres]